MTGLQVTFAIVTAALALYGAVLSTYNTIHERRRRKPQLAVTFSHGLIGYGGGGASPALLILGAGNSGERPVTISSAYLDIPCRKQSMFGMWHGEVELPHQLLPGEGCQLYIEQATVARELVRIGLSGRVTLVAAFHDQIGNTYRSRPMEFGIEEALK